MPVTGILRGFYHRLCQGSKNCMAILATSDVVSYENPIVSAQSTNFAQAKGWLVALCNCMVYYVGSPW